MNYQEFRAAWDQALAEAGMQFHPFPATETVDIGDMSRTYQLYVPLAYSHDMEPFHVTARLSWTWNAMLAARAATVEEDALMQFLGDERRHLDTEQPCLRVDVILHATLPWGAPLPLPGTARWREWVTDVTGRLVPLLPVEIDTGERAGRVLSWRGEPMAEVVCADDGQLHLSGVTLKAWQAIDLPRQWDDPEREPDEGPDEQLADLAERVSEAMDEWSRCLAHLLPHDAR